MDSLHPLLYRDQICHRIFQWFWPSISNLNIIFPIFIILIKKICEFLDGLPWYIMTLWFDRDDIGRARRCKSRLTTGFNSTSLKFLVYQGFYFLLSFFTFSRILFKFQQMSLILTLLLKVTQHRRLNRSSWGWLIFLVDLKLIN